MNIPSNIPHADSAGTSALTVASASIDVASPGFATTYQDTTPNQTLGSDPGAAVGDRRIVSTT